MTYSVYQTESFRKEMNKLPQEEQGRIKNLFLQLKENPYVGDSLQIKALREKRLLEKRIYYLVFDSLHSVLVVAISDKKSQQKTINYIIKYINDYRNYLKELLEKDN